MADDVFGKHQVEDGQGTYSQGNENDHYEQLKRLPNNQLIRSFTCDLFIDFIQQRS